MQNVQHTYKIFHTFSSPKKYLCIIFFISASFKTYSQAADFFIRHGDIRQVSCGNILFSALHGPDFVAHSAGALLVKKPIDLKQPFESSFILDFTDTLGSDGGSFLFQSDSSSLGGANYGIGYRGIDRSLAITFDGYQNDADKDPVFDHIAIQANGDINHMTTNNLAGPLSMESFYTFISGVKTFHHLITVKWDPSLKVVSVLIDNVPFISAQDDIIQKIFNGNSQVYWGFTSSCTQLNKYPKDSDIVLSHFAISYGIVTPRFRSQPEVDTCFVQPIQFFDNSIYTVEAGIDNFKLFKWYWNFGDGIVNTSQNPPPHNYPGPGKYTLKFTATNQLGCASDTAIKVIGLGSNPIVNFATTPGCTNEAISFTDSTFNSLGTNIKWMWMLDDNNISSEQNARVTYTSPGLKKITLTVTTEYGCKGDTTQTINLTDHPVIDFTFQQNCNAAVQYGAVLNNEVPVEKWLWNFGDRRGSFSQDPLHQFEQNGSYQSSVSAVTSSGCKSTVTKTVAIDKVYPYAGNDTLIAIGQPLQLQASGGLTYKWFPSSGLSDAFIANPVATLSSAQTYYLSVKNAEGCEALDTINIKVFKGPDIYVPNAFTPNNDGLNDILNAVAPGFKEISFFKIYNRTGKIMFQTKSLKDGWDGTLKGILQPAGVYVWVINAVTYKDKAVTKKGAVMLIR